MYGYWLMLVLLLKDPGHKGIPTGVAIDPKANIKIIFALSNVSHTITAVEVEAFRKFKSTGSLPTPVPPKLLNATTNKLSLSWEDCLFLPVGIVQQLEVQFTQVVNARRLTGDEKWATLATKAFYNANFFTHEHTHLRCNQFFRFRLRYRTVADWSDYSEPSPAFGTKADRPSQPAPPVCIAITSNAIHLKWGKDHVNDNGSELLEFVLMGRSVGDDFFEMYRGLQTSYLSIGLFPEFAYSYKLSAVNAIGQSEFSVMTSVQTPAAVLVKELTSWPPPRPGAKPNSSNTISLPFNELQIMTAIQCREAWRECWDPRGQQTFYYNKIIALRQLDKPDVLKEKHEEDGGEPPEETEEQKAAEREKLFRTKRYRLIRALHKKLKDQGPSMPLGYRQRSPTRRSSMGGAPSPSRRTSQDRSAPLESESLPILPAMEPASEAVAPLTPAAKSKVLRMTLQRESMLSDCFDFFQTIGTAADMTKRLKVDFEGEAGIDSGGIGKEAFLLVSKEVGEFVGAKQQAWMQFMKCSSSASSSGLSNEEEKKKENLDSKQMALQEKHRHVLEGYGFCSNHEISKVAVSTGSQKFQKFVEQRVDCGEFCYFMGQFLGKALFDRQLVDLPLSSLVLHHALGGIFNRELAINGQLEFDAKIREEVECVLGAVQRYSDASFSSLMWMLKNCITDVIDETFSVCVDAVKGTMLPLCADGENRAVTEENKVEYVKLMLLWKLQYGVSDCLQPFLEGFHSIVPLDCLQSAEINVQELSLILNGKPCIDVDEIHAYTMYQTTRPLQFNEACNLVVWFWRMFREFSEENKQRLLLFFTGSSKVPLDGYDPPLNITEGVDKGENSLPVAHTCFNQLVIPAYSSFEVMRDKFLFAIANTHGFELA